MSKMQRIRSVLQGILMIACGIFIFWDTETGLVVASTVLAVSLIVTGLRFLFYYFTMAHFMVGGRAILLIGILVLDFGLYTFILIDEPRLFVILYLLAVHGFSGLVNMMHALEERRYHAPHWKLDFFQGTVDILIALSSICFLNNYRILAILYCIGLFSTAVLRIISAFRNTEIVYIQ